VCAATLVGEPTERPIGRLLNGLLYHW
jgi:hypothetical protein